MVKQPTNWKTITDEELLNHRICELDIRIEAPNVKKGISQLYQELDSKGILFHPPCYLADEWFVPSSETVLGIPFYLSHPRLIKLEEAIMLDVEGETHEEFMKLIRHEAGHAIYNAYNFKRNKKIRILFGPPSDETPDTYQPKPYSRNYVKNLDNDYAQCDPDEDFAETFAAWLNPDIDWKTKYKSWGAFKKLEFMDELIKSIQTIKPYRTTNDFPYAAKKSKSKLTTFYNKRKKMLEEDFPDFFDKDLVKIFTKKTNNSNKVLAHHYMRKNRKLIVSKVASWSGAKKYTVNNLLNSLIDRCQSIQLRLKSEARQTTIDLCCYLTSMTANFHYTGRLRRKK